MKEVVFAKKYEDIVKYAIEKICGGRLKRALKNETDSKDFIKERLNFKR